jgi:hypothetical protein
MISDREDSCFEGQRARLESRTIERSIGIIAVCAFEDEDRLGNGGT